MGLNIKNEESGNDKVVSSPDPIVWTLILSGILVLVLIIPFICSKQRRRICYRRFIQHGNWDNNDEGEDEGNETTNGGILSFISNHGVIVRRYPIGDPRHKFTHEEAENESKRYILDKLLPYSKTIESDDFVLAHADVEEGTISCSSLPCSSYSEPSASQEISQMTINTHHQTETYINIPINSSSDEEEDNSANTSIANHDNAPENRYDHDAEQKEKKHAPCYNDNINIDEEPEEKWNSAAKNMKLKLPSPGVSLSEYENNFKKRDDQSSASAPLPALKGSIDRQAFGVSCHDLTHHNSDEKSSLSSNSKGGSSDCALYRSNECSICLGSFCEGEMVSWSASDDCEHLFHQECILDWLMVQGRKSLGKGESIVGAHLYRFNMKCPNCRQDFIPKK